MCKNINGHLKSNFHNMKANIYLQNVRTFHDSKSSERVPCKTIPSLIRHWLFQRMDLIIKRWRDAWNMQTSLPPPRVPAFMIPIAIHIELNRIRTWTPRRSIMASNQFLCRCVVQWDSLRLMCRPLNENYLSPQRRSDFERSGIHHWST
jgi:hypothetical protein